jgi:uncharacterized protein with ATP-grasp and redox domains
MDIDCISCFHKQANKLFAKYGIHEDVSKDILSRLDLFVARHGHHRVSSPEASCLMHRLIKKATKKEDPYKTEKERYNNLLLSLEEDIRSVIEKSDSPFQTALRYALAGNIIDFGPPKTFDVFKALSGAVMKKPAIDHSIELGKALHRASSVLYLGDNAGEIVLDKLFIETINHPNLTFAVRGNKIINDVTMEDAEYTGIHNISHVISNGYDAPSTMPDRCSSEFMRTFDEADVIISKGQGNLEGLIGMKSQKIFFLLTVKCNVIANLLQVPENSSVVLFNQTMQKSGIDIVP